MIRRLESLKKMNREQYDPKIVWLMWTLYTLGLLELEGRICKLEELFAYLKAKKNGAKC